MSAHTLWLPQTVTAKDVSCYSLFWILAVIGNTFTVIASFSLAARELRPWDSLNRYEITRHGD